MTPGPRAPAPWRFAGASLACGAWLCAACTLLTPVDGLAGGPAGADDDASEDAGTADRFVSPVDAARSTDARGPLDAMSDATSSDTGADAAVVELHPNGTFEDGIVPWVSYHGTVASDTTPRTGAHSLRACAQASVPSDNVFSADDSGAVLGPIVGATYHASAWVRTAPGAAADPSSVNLLFRTIDRAPAFAEIETVYAPSITIGTTWTKIEIDLVVTKTAEALNVAVTGHYGAGACFLVDDVSVVRVD